MSTDQPLAALQQRASEMAQALGRANPPAPDALAAALARLARASGFCGPLPADDAAPGPFEIERAAELALRFELRLDPRPLPLRALTPEDCPALVVDAAGGVRVLEAIDAQTARLAGPDGEIEIVTLATASDTLRAFRVRPLAAPAAARAGSFLADALGGVAPAYLHALGATLAINVLALALPLYTMNVYDRVLPNNAGDTLVALSAGAMLALLFDFALRTLRGALLDRASQKIDVRLANRLFARMLGAKLPPRAPSIGVQANTLREYETLRELISSTTLTVLGDLPFALLFLIVMLSVSGALTLVVVVAVPLIVLANAAVNWPLARLQEQAFQDVAARNAIVVETLHGRETIKALGAERWAAQRHERAVAEQLRVGFWSRAWGVLGLNIVQIGQGLVTVAMVVIGAGMVWRGEMSGGALMAAMMLVGRVLGPFSQLAAMVGKIHAGRLAWQAVQGMAQAPQERAPAQRFVALPERMGEIAIEGLSFAYGPQAPASLEGITLRIAPGERVGFIGAIGSGKSTLLRLLLKLHEPAAGRLLIGGVPLADIDPCALRRRIGYCGQAPQLFQGSLRQNLTLHRPEASDAELLAACRLSGALAWIGRLPHGFETMLQENGAGLSGGQRQTLALARALIGRLDLLLLDEPTSDMDGRGEAQVVAQLKDALGPRTLVLVTHRPALLELVDRLVVFDQGRIMADGPKDKVLEALRAQNARGAAA